ncbi:MAG TPA: xanthine dehydrogenase family protein molybdopterin-binding subunit [Spirochaetes bacterium]|nr:xanthine dehydrogenase family protein molybdopterin-binding subunit [Spirochaetota bacterium]
MSDKKFVGEDVTDIRSVNKVTGATRYAADINLPGMLYAVMVRSEYAHAIVKDIDKSEALKVRGVVSIVTYKDFPGLHFGTYVHDQVAFTSHPRYVGDPIAAVAAETQEIAEKAARLVAIKYEILPHILNPEVAFKSEKIILHPDMHTYKAYAGFFNYKKSTNVPNHMKVRKGDIEKGFEESDLVVESRITVPPIYHGNIETHACVCQYDPDGHLFVQSCTQGPFLLREMLSSALGIPLNRITVLHTAVGGGFGGKISGNIEIRAAAIAQRCEYRPVKMALSRREEWETVYTRQSLIGYYKTGAKKNGKIIARKVTLYWDAGAYADYEVSVARSAGFMSAGPYDIPNVWVDSYAVYTNKLVATAYRGFGCSETTFCYEQDMDIVAKKLGLDPVEFRLKNAFERGMTNVTGQRLRSCALKDCINLVNEKAGPEPEKSGNCVIKRGRGIAVMHKFTVHTVPTADIVKLNEDGTITLETSAVDIGQGSDTIMAQILADVLGIGIDKITVVPIHTDYSGYGWQTAASSKTFFNGNSTIRAGLDLRKKILHYGSMVLHIPESDLATKDGKIYSISEPGKSIPFSAVSLGVFNEEGGQYGGPVIGYGVFTVEDGSFLDPQTGKGRKPSAFWMFAAMIAEVEVNTETGNIRVVRLVSANDVGKAINPKMVKGQMDGGAIQGLGSALFEEVLINDEGKVMNANMHDYKMPTIGDCPDEVLSMPVETQPHPDGPFGAKGVGEPAMACPAAAIANAVADALGVRIYSMPLTPEKVLDALEARPS